MRRQAQVEAAARLPAMGAGRILALICLCLGLYLIPAAAPALQPGGMHLREAPGAAAGISLDQAVAMAEQRYKARVVRAEVDQRQQRRVYMLRLLSEEGRVWTVRVDAATGSMF
ncbi:MAG: PepSY domain-containing protein [Steroidobacteraceae bacterium]